jgi:RNA polymerase sigma factor (TIGR02999 family)
MTNRMPDEITPVTRLLQRWQEGEQGALEEITPLVYHELRRIAASHLRRERSGHTLRPTELLHEASLHLIRQQDQSWQNRAHFYGVAAHLMRHILVDHARAPATAANAVAACRRSCLMKPSPRAHVPLS